MWRHSVIERGRRPRDPVDVTEWLLALGHSCPIVVASPGTRLNHVGGEGHAHWPVVAAPLGEYQWHLVIGDPRARRSSFSRSALMGSVYGRSYFFAAPAALVGDGWQDHPAWLFALVEVVRLLTSGAWHAPWRL